MFNVDALDTSGRGTGLWALGLLIHFCVLVMATVQLAGASHRWTLLHLASVAVSLLLWFGSVFLFGAVPVLSSDLIGIPARLLACPSFWLTTVAVTAVGILPRAVASAWTSLFKPTARVLITEAQAKLASSDGDAMHGLSDRSLPLAAGPSARGGREASGADAGAPARRPASPLKREATAASRGDRRRGARRGGRQSASSAGMTRDGGHHSSGRRVRSADASGFDLVHLAGAHVSSGGFGTALGSGGAVWERGEASDSPRTPTSELSARSTDNLLGRGRGVVGFTGRDRESPSLSPHLPGRIG